MAITSASAVSSLIGPRPSKRKFKLRTGGRIMATTRGKKKMSSRRGGSRRPATRGKKKKR
tara:strand:- start:193 stop:372 length:180 start_codon:yes stop_codon:yes gene_type:complete